jgi:spheroidene monooxygenase
MTTRKQRRSMDATTVTISAVSGVVVVLLVDYLTKHRAWGWVRVVQGSSGLKDTSGLLFSKVMGSGHGGGFGLRPSGSHQGLVCLFEDEAAATQFCRGSQVQAIIDHAREHWLGMLAVTSARGQWDQQAWEVTPQRCLSVAEEAPLELGADEPVAVLTRGSIRPAKAVAFWRYAPGAQAELDADPACHLAMGLGEAPLLRQCTFSLWRNTASMLGYAHGGAHKLAINAAYKNDYFSESMFVRMRVLAMSGYWLGQSYDFSREAAHV